MISYNLCILIGDFSPLRFIEIYNRLEFAIYFVLSTVLHFPYAPPSTSFTLFI